MKHGQRIGRLLYSQMAAAPDATYGRAIGLAYNPEALTLTKQFAQE